MDLIYIDNVIMILNLRKHVEFINFSDFSALNQTGSNSMAVRSGAVK